MSERGEHQDAIPAPKYRVNADGELEEEDERHQPNVGCSCGGRSGRGAGDHFLGSQHKSRRSGADDATNVFSSCARHHAPSARHEGGMSAATPALDAAQLIRKPSTRPRPRPDSDAVRALQIGGAQPHQGGKEISSAARDELTPGEDARPMRGGSQRPNYRCYGSARKMKVRSAAILRLARRLLPLLARLKPPMPAGEAGARTVASPSVDRRPQRVCTVRAPSV